MLEVDIPEVLSELTAEFKRYEAALLANDIAAINAFFWNSPLTVRYGVRAGECHYTYADIASFRLKRGAVNQTRTLVNTRVTTFGRDFGITNTEYRAATSDKMGRQSQTWVRTEDGWKIVSAHVSIGA